MNHEEWLAQAEIYALGALDGEELSLFEAHLRSGCAACEGRLRETRETLRLFPESLPPLLPPPAVKRRLMAEIPGPAARPAERSRLGWLWWGMGAGALAAASLTIVLGWQLLVARQALRGVQEQLATLQLEAALRQEVVRLLADPQVRLVQLAGLPPSPAAAGRLLWNPGTRAGLLLTTGLPQAPTGRTYELWAITGAEPVPAGVFAVDQAGRAVFRLPPLPEARTFDKFAVTLEPAGGVPAPTGPMHLLGSL